jgi:hypothetical protein
MSKKDFIALADTLRAFYETNAGREMDQMSRGILMQHIANFCQSQNSNFKRDRWLSYIAGECGPNGGAIKA